LVERRPYKANVGGSTPSAPTRYLQYFLFKYFLFRYFLFLLEW
jgi:hypothetical protein